MNEQLRRKSLQESVLTNDGDETVQNRTGIVRGRRTRKDIGRLLNMAEKWGVSGSHASIAE